MTRRQRAAAVQAALTGYVHRRNPGFYHPAPRWMADCGQVVDWENLGEAFMQGKSPAKLPCLGCFPYGFPRGVSAPKGSG